MKDRRLLIIFGIVLVDMLSFSLVLPLLPYYAKEFGASPHADRTDLLVLSAHAGARGARSWADSPTSGDASRCCCLSIAGTACALLMLGFANSLWMLFASRMLDGITGGNISVAQAYMTDVTSEKDRGKAFGLIGAAFGIGFILGPVTGGLLAAVGQPLPAFVAAALALGSTCCSCCSSCRSRSRRSAAHR